MRVDYRKRLQIKKKTFLVSFWNIVFFWTYPLEFLFWLENIHSKDLDVEKYAFFGSSALSIPISTSGFSAMDFFFFGLN